MARKDRSARALRIALAQINTTVGDVEGNAERARDWIGRARAEGAHLVVLPELTISGYPPEDLLLKPHFLEAGRRALRELASESRDIVAMVGFADADGFTHNSLAVLADGEIKGTYTKMLLPNYGVFDERRYFEPGSSPALIELGGVMIGLSICEDVWFPGPPASAEALAGASLIVNASASPYHRGKGTEREHLVVQRARETGAAFALCNAVGGQDELIFDGHSVIVSEAGETLARARQFVEELVVCDLELSVPEAAGRKGPGQVPAGLEAPVIARLDAEPRPERRGDCPIAEPLDRVAEVYEALKLGLRDYVEKNAFEHVVLALSGGVDSALVALIAVDALGAERVTCVVMPSPHSSDETQEDARRIAANLGVELIEIPIEPAMEAYHDLLSQPFAGADREPAAAPDAAARRGEAAAELTAENIQARIRGNLVMALSNRRGWLVLTTGNKSELSVGYATLYGDMAGGFAVIKDVPKTLVYELVRYRNELEGRELVPASVLERAPSAELAPGQRDEDSLPPYEVLDRILEAYVERDEGPAQIAQDGIAEELVRDVIRMVDRAEYKRRQAPPGIKITPKAFGRDRRLPITNRFGG
jgi:NAD+ synthase (glutamine-hydrolysing)